MPNRAWEFDSPLGHLISATSRSRGPVVKTSGRHPENRWFESIRDYLRTRPVGVPAARVFGKDEDRVQFPDGPLRDMKFESGPSSNGKTSAWHAGPVNQKTGRVQLPPGPLEEIRKVAGYGWPGRTANAVLEER